MGQAVDIVDLHKTMHTAAYLPIHEFMKRIIPYLELRQELAKKWTSKPMGGEERTLIYTEIHKCNQHIKEVLAINDELKELI